MKPFRLVSGALLALLAQGTQAGCSAATVAGNWAFRLTSVDFYNDRFCAGVGVVRFTSSNKTASIVADYESCNGVSQTGSGSGQYTLASNCIGTMNATTNQGTPLDFRFVTDNGGTRMKFILVTSGQTLTGDADRQ